MIWSSPRPDARLHKGTGRCEARETGRELTEISAAVALEIAGSLLPAVCQYVPLTRGPENACFRLAQQ